MLSLGPIRRQAVVAGAGETRKRDRKLRVADRETPAKESRMSAKFAAIFSERGSRASSDR